MPDKKTSSILIIEHTTHTRAGGASKKGTVFRRMMPNIYQGEKQRKNPQGEKNSLRKTQQKPALKQHNRTHNEHNMTQHELLSTLQPQQPVSTQTPHPVPPNLQSHRTEENTLNTGRGGRVWEKTTKKLAFLCTTAARMNPPASWMTYIHPCHATSCNIREHIFCTSTDRKVYLPNNAPSMHHYQHATHITIDNM